MKMTLADVEKMLELSATIHIHDVYYDQRSNDLDSLLGEHGEDLLVIARRDFYRQKINHPNDEEIEIGIKALESVDSLLSEAGYQPDSSARHHLSWGLSVLREVRKAGNFPTTR